MKELEKKFDEVSKVINVQSFMYMYLELSQLDKLVKTPAQKYMRRMSRFCARIPLCKSFENGYLWVQT